MLDIESMTVTLENLAIYGNSSATLHCANGFSGFSVDGICVEGGGGRRGGEGSSGERGVGEESFCCSLFFVLFCNIFSKFILMQVVSYWMVSLCATAQLRSV